jgi:hypothetical protein
MGVVKVLHDETEDGPAENDDNDDDDDDEWAGQPWQGTTASSTIIETQIRV